MPAHHRFRKNQTPQRIQARAARVGPNVAIFTDVVMRDRKHPEQGYRACLGVIRLAGKFGRDRLDAVCRRALENEPLERHWSERQWRAPGLIPTS